MELNHLIHQLNYEVLTNNPVENETVSNVYICDLLSHAMSKLKKGDLWITVQVNINIVAIAVLTECAAIIIPESILVDQGTIEKANKEGVTILKADKTAYETAVLIKGVL